MILFSNNKRSIKFFEHLEERCSKIHNNKYDYTYTVYKSSQDRVCITCPTHGDFYQLMSNHLNRKSGCPKCAREVLPQCTPNTLDNFISSANLVHHNKYDYSKFVYSTARIGSIIICPIH